MILFNQTIIMFISSHVIVKIVFDNIHEELMILLNVLIIINGWDWGEEMIGLTEIDQC